MIAIICGILPPVASYKAMVRSEGGSRRCVSLGVRRRRCPAVRPCRCAGSDPFQGFLRLPVPRSSIPISLPCSVPSARLLPATARWQSRCPSPSESVSESFRPIRPNPSESVSESFRPIRPNPCPSHSGPSVCSFRATSPPPPPFPPGHGGRIPVRGQVLPWSVREAQDTPQETYPRPARPALVPYVPLPTCALAYPFLAFTRPLRLPPSPPPSFPWRRSNGIQGFDGMSGPGAGGAAADRMSRQRYAAAGRFGHGCCQPAIMIGSEGAACIAVD